MDANVNVDGFRTVMDDTGFITATASGVEKLTGNTEFVIDVYVNVDGFDTVTVMVDG